MGPGNSGDPQRVTVRYGRDRVLRALRACPRNAFLPAPHNRPPEAFVDQPVRQGRCSFARSGAWCKQCWMPLSGSHWHILHLDNSAALAVWRARQRRLQVPHF